MEENQNNENNVQEVQNANVEQNETTNSTSENSNATKENVAKVTEKIKEKLGAFIKILKAKKKLVISILVVILVLVFFCNIVIGSPKKEVKSFISAYNSMNVKKLYNQVDWAGYLAFKNIKDKEYDDFWDNYSDAKDSDDYEDLKETLDDDLDDAIEDLKDDLEDEDYKIQIKKVKKIKKLAKNLYEVKVQLKTEIDGEKDTTTTSLYVMKKGLSYYMVGGDLVSALYYNLIY